MPINLKDLTKTVLKDGANRQETSENIAIIGMACRFASANTKDEYWQLLKRGEDCIKELPKNRQKRNEPLLKIYGNSAQANEYFRGGFLQEIDKFDFELFNISPLEASLMSPHQRMFLETALSAIEDAGYGGKRIAGSKTGVFLGHSTDFGVSYKEFIEQLNPSLASLAIPGNLNSIIASRICYLLDLKGPSMIIDTACSSSLVAVHMACLSLKKRECSMALAGAVTIDLLPLKRIKRKEDELGITSPDGITRAFDDTAQGMGPGEGVGALLLKPLSLALEDGDHIYAIIRGSAINQDGNSANLTSPNPLAQTELIVKAWQEAGIDPETVTYIEAHGTGTELGDPVEIAGIEKAFKRYTTMKQFCGVGSVKTNIGHLDHTAGLAGLFKVVLALKHKELPASLHFRKPNSKIHFEDSPVYVNDIHREWKTGRSPRYCGVSSFGLSGTNCHVVLQEAPITRTSGDVLPDRQLHLLTLSAKSREGILELIWQYQLFLLQQPDINLNSLCYTANTGRGQYSYRLAIPFQNLKELHAKLEQAVVLDDAELAHHGIFYGTHKVVSEKQSLRESGEITQGQKAHATKQANLELKEASQEPGGIPLKSLSLFCEKYVGGADIEWERLYKGTPQQKVSLPGYPFSKKSCWVETNLESITRQSPYSKELEHPLLDRCIAHSFDRIIYSSTFAVNTFWILHEHRVAGTCVVPGTAYLEMVTEILRLHYSGWDFQLREVIFLSPLALKEDETVEVHSVLKNEPDGLAFTITSKLVHDNEWKIHVEGKVQLLVHKDEDRLDLERIKQTQREGNLETFAYEPGKGIETGPRWNCLTTTYIGTDEVMADLCIPKDYLDELKYYTLHPALMDEAANVALRSIGAGLYLPFSYKSMIVMGRLPARIYSYVQRKNAQKTHTEFGLFDITLSDENGTKLVQIEDYKIKKVDEGTIQAASSAPIPGYAEIVWNASPIVSHSRGVLGQNMIVFSGQGSQNEQIVNALRGSSGKVLEVECGEVFEVVSEAKIFIRPSEADYLQVFQQSNDVQKILFMQALSEFREITSIKDLEEQQRQGVYSLFNLVKALVKSKSTKNVELVIIAQYAHEVEKPERSIRPGNAALFGLAKAIHLEYPGIQCRSIDIDDATTAETIVAELSAVKRNDLIAYRSNQRFVPCLESIKRKSVPAYPFSIRENGVYMITGGMGGIGIEVARFLSSFAPVNIVLLNRSPFPPIEQWEQILKTGDDTKLCSKIRVLNEIRQSGSQIAHYDADVSDMTRMQEVLCKVRNTFGQIHGLFHAAGNAGDGFMINRSLDAFRNVLAPKVEGTWILDTLTQEDHLDFFVLFSSISALIAEAGQADYAAANSYLNAYSCAGRGRNARMITINWPAWREVGMAVDYHVDFTKEVFSPITTRTAIEVLQEVLQKDFQNIIIGDLNYDIYSNKWSQVFDLTPKMTARIASQKSFLPLQNAQETIVHAFQVTLTGAKNAEAYTETEQKIANIVGNALGLLEVNIYKSFLELGGNSILAIKIEMDMEKVGIPLSILDLYEYKTLKDLADFLDTRSNKRERTKHMPSTGPEKKPQNEEDQGREVASYPTTTRLVLADIQPFNEIFYKTCFHNSLFPVLTHFHVSLAPFLANDLFVYNFYHKEQESFENRMRNIAAKTLSTLLADSGIAIKAQSHARIREREMHPSSEDKHLLQQFSEYIGMKPQASEQHTSSPLSDIKEALTKGRPVILWVDCFHLSDRKDTYQKEHWMHTLLLYGIDEAREVFFAIEHSFKGNLTYKEREITFKDVLTSYDGFLANYAQDAEMPTFYEFFSMPQPAVMQDYREVYGKNVQKQKDTIGSGLENLKLVVERMREIFTSEQDLEKNIDELLDILNSIISAKQLEIYIISALFDDIHTIKEAAKNALDIWLHVRQILVKYKFSSVYQSNKMSVLFQEINTVYLLERQYYSALFARLMIV